MTASEPVKPKKLSPYFVFCKQHRDEVKARLQQAGQPASAAAITKALGEQWRSLSPEQKQKYSSNDQLGAEVPSRTLETSNQAPDVQSAGLKTLQMQNKATEIVQSDTSGQQEKGLETLETSGQQNKEHETVETENGGPEILEIMPNEAGQAQGQGKKAGERGLELDLPLSRVKRIIKMDKDIRVVAADASVLIVQAAQLFLEHLTSLAYAACARRKRRTLRLEDLQAAIKAEARVDDFLTDALREFLSEEGADGGEESGSEEEDIAAAPDAKQHDINGSSSKRGKASNKKPVPPPVGNRRIGDFFGTNKSTVPLQVSSSEAA